MKNYEKELSKRIIAYDCRYYLGDRPCVWHKKETLLCECDKYSQVQNRILIIKLDAMGDVLRTTCLLPAIYKAFHGACISWLTRPESTPLLENNPYVSEIISYGPDALVQLSSRKFDKVINLDAGIISASLATMAKSSDKTGFLMHEQGYVYATNSNAEKWLRLGLFDDLKKENTKTYQMWMLDILGLESNAMHYVFELTDAEKIHGRQTLIELGVNLKNIIIGVHTGAGARWPQKQWGEDRVKAFANTAAKNNYQIVLFGGPQEIEMNRRIMAQSTSSIFDTGCDNSVRQFAAMLDCCNVVLSGDTLAMHIALALRKRVVVLFGPTSHNEIDLFDLGEKIIPQMNCLGCYKKECNYKPTCMESISIEHVIDAIQRQVEMLRVQ